MKKNIFALAAFLLSMGTFAQDASIVEEIVAKNIKEKAALNAKIDSIERHYNAVVAEKNKEIELLRKNSSELQKKDAELKQKDNEINNLKNRMKAYDSLDDLIYRQCLLFPLERKYNERLVTQSIQCLQALELDKNERYQKVYNDYFPILQNYELYTQEIAGVLSATLQSQSFGSLETLRKSGQTSVVAKIDQIKEYAAAQFNTTGYCKYYKDKNGPKSAYLNSVLDEFHQLPADKFTRENIQTIIEKLK